MYRIELFFTPVRVAGETLVRRMDRSCAAFVSLLLGHRPMEWKRDRSSALSLARSAQAERDNESCFFLGRRVALLFHSKASGSFLNARELIDKFSFASSQYFRSALEQQVKPSTAAVAVLSAPAPELHSAQFEGFMSQGSRYRSRMSWANYFSNSFNVLIQPWR
ncbi:hypothetical protein EVAR_97157_1 [Eumeta japonica]|uniref:Uncharacterized protein n=1 Tax=Eumeta variegata TaxID=151549 RepID=A0A4C1XQJ1_EUMVA|nr:hypothetical protein EVAR_97157_1 [Eumeta japonica]